MRQVWPPNPASESAITSPILDSIDSFFCLGLPDYQDKCRYAWQRHGECHNEEPEIPSLFRRYSSTTS